MGVIDLDARVKKLEEGGAGGAVIDQLEAAVTDLEETVNGNGETDFGLVGDVAALEETVNGDGDTDPGLVGNVAALEETVNGDGDTDLGLVGDVAALQTAISGAATITDVSNKITLTSGTGLDSSSKKVAYQIGKMIVLSASGSITVGGSSAGQNYNLFNIDSSISPYVTTSALSLNISNANYSAYVDSSHVIITSGSSYKFTICWIIA